MEAGKISSPLAGQLKGSPGADRLEVIVELAKHDVQEPVNADRAMKMEARKRAFEQQAEPVVRLIQSLGGEVTGQAWINSSLRARLDKNMISSLSTNSNVSRLDLPIC